jgi:hypothetical protein
MFLAERVGRSVLGWLGKRGRILLLSSEKEAKRLCVLGCALRRDARDKIEPEAGA